MNFFYHSSWMLYLPIVICMAYGITYLFFDSWVISSISAILAFGFKSPLKKQCNLKELKKIEQEFMSFIYAVSSILSIGRSFNRAVVLSIQELYKENSTCLLRNDFDEILILVEANCNPDELFDVFANKYCIESMINFSKIIKIALKQGSSLNKVIENTVMMIDVKMDVEKELEVIIAQKKFELIILLTFLPLIVVYLKSVSQNFSETMYGTFIGRFVMLCCLCIYIVSGLLGKRIVDIQV